MGCIFSKPKAKAAKIIPYQPKEKVATKTNGPNKIVKMKSFHSKKLDPSKPKVTRKVSHNDSDWAIYIDEFRNPYFYNLINGNSEWNIPAEISPWPEFKITGYVTAVISIPDDAVAGKEFSIEVYSQVIDVTCPSDSFPGDEIDLHFPLHVDQVLKTESANSAKDVKDVFIDASIAWAALAKVANEDLSEIERIVAIAKDVLKEVSGGCYLDTLIFQLTWSYRVAQLETAVKDCYKKNGDYKDSSAYDNCKGVRKYDKGGLIEWWHDLKGQRQLLEKKLETKEHDKVFGDNSLFHDDASKHYALEESMLSGDANAILRGLLDRQKVVETELDNDVARVLAIVSIEGPPPPPSRESMDMVHDYFLELVESNADMGEVSEEIEEFVGCALEPRHKFCVDILLSMALLEYELESLVKQISGLKPQTDSKKDSASNKEKKDSIDVKEQNEAIQNLIANQHLSANQLQEQLLAKKNAKKKSLIDRLEQRKIKRVTQLMKEGMTQEAAEAQVQAENEVEILDTMNKFDDDCNAAINEFNTKALEDLVGLAGEETKRLNDELNFQKEQKLKSLQDRLDKRKADKKAELESNGNPETLANDIELANLELDNEAEQEKLDIENEFLGDTQKKRESILNEIISQHEIEAQRLEDELLHTADRNKKALKNRLNQRLQKKASQIMNQEKEAGNEMTVAESLALAQTECEAEEAESFKKLEEDIQKKLVDSQSTIANSLTDLHSQELKRLDAELVHKEELHKNSLQSRLERRKKANQIQIDSTEDEAKKEELKKEIVADEAKVNDELSAIAENLKNQHLEGSSELTEKLLTKQNDGQKNTKDRLAKRKDAKKKADDANVILVEDMISKLKSEQKDQLKRLKDLVDYEKKVNTRHKQSKEKAKLLMQYSIMNDSMIEGFKKRSLYHQKAIKSAATAPSIPLEEAKKLETPEIISQASTTALEQIVLRGIRDMGGLVDVQNADKCSVVLKMKESGASKLKVSEAEIRLDEGNRSDLMADFQKVLYSIVGLSVQVDDLMDTTGEASAKLSKQSSDLDLDDDDEAIVCSASIKAWFSGCQQLANMYTDTLTSLCEYLEDANRKLLSESSDNFDASQEIKKQLIKANLAVIVNSASVTSKTPTNINVGIIETSIANTYPSQQQLVDEVFSKCTDAAIVDTYKKSFNDWLKHPILTEEELSTKKAVNATPMLSSKSSRHLTQKVGDKERETELSTSLTSKVEKKRKELERTLEGDAKDKALSALNTAFDDIKKLISQMPESKLNDINADGLVAAVDRIAAGTEVTADDLDDIQKDVEKIAAAKDTEKLMQQQLDSASNLDIAMKVKRAKDQQSLQERLLKRKKKE